MKKYKNVLSLHVTKETTPEPGRYLYSEFVINYNEAHAKSVQNLTITKRTKNHLTYNVLDDRIVLGFVSKVPAGVSASYAKELKGGTLHEDLVDIHYCGDGRHSAQHVNNTTFKLTDYISVDEELIHPAFEYPESVFNDILDILLLVGNIDLIHGFEEGLLRGPKEMTIE